MKTTPLFRDVLLFTILFVGLIGGAILVDAALHFMGYVWIGRYFGIVGTLLILLSFIYSLRKYRLIRIGAPVNLLRWHEYLTWIGSLMILVHGGIHFNAWLPWYAMMAMVIAVASGVTGKILMSRSRGTLEAKRDQLKRDGLKDTEIEETLFWDSLAYRLMKKWRVVHLPITLFFALLSVLHILTIFIFWGWR